MRVHIAEHDEKGFNMRVQFQGIYPFSFKTTNLPEEEKMKVFGVATALGYGASANNDDCQLVPTKVLTEMGVSTDLTKGTDYFLFRDDLKGRHATGLVAVNQHASNDITARWFEDVFKKQGDVETVRVPDGYLFELTADALEKRGQGENVPFSRDMVTGYLRRGGVRTPGDKINRN